MKKQYIISFALLISSVSMSLHSESNPLWLESDSVLAIQSRIESDFSITLEDGLKTISKSCPSIDISDYESFINNHYIEVKTINGEKKMHRKSPGNFKLLCPQIRGKWNGRGGNPDAEDAAIIC